MRAYVFGILYALTVFIASVGAFLGVAMVMIYLGYRAGLHPYINNSIVVLVMSLMMYAIVPLSLRLFEGLSQMEVSRFVYSATVFYFILYGALTLIGSGGVQVAMTDLVTLVVMVLVFYVVTVRAVRK